MYSLTSTVRAPPAWQRTVPLLPTRHGRLSGPHRAVQNTESGVPGRLVGPTTDRRFRVRVRRPPGGFCTSLSRRSGRGFGRRDRPMAATRIGRCALTRQSPHQTRGGSGREGEAGGPELDEDSACHAAPTDPAQAPAQRWRLRDRAAAPHAQMRSRRTARSGPPGRGRDRR
jgi:hypothetical protein